VNIPQNAGGRLNSVRPIPKIKLAIVQMGVRREEAMIQDDAARPAPSGRQRRWLRAALKAIAVIAVTAALSVILWPVARDAVSRTAPAAETARGAAAPGNPATDEPRKSHIEGDSGLRLIREAHSDGGYWYWLERQPEEMKH
jgi:hypothetical protein